MTLRPLAETPARTDRGARTRWLAVALALATISACGGDGERDGTVGEAPGNATVAPAAITDAPEPEPQTAIHNPTDLAALQKLWSEERYADALPLLIDYRKTAPYGKNEVVDYMIGTSACRIPAERELGRKMLRWVLAHYSLNPESRDVVRSELDRCTTAAAVPVSLMLVSAGPTSASGTRGKMFYTLGEGGGQPLANEPVKVTRRIPAEEFAARLKPPERSEDAVALVRDLAGPGYEVIAHEGFVVASRTHPVEEMRTIAEMLARYRDFYASTYSIPRPPELITIYLTSTGRELQSIADRVHGIAVSPASLGYSFRDDQSMVGIIPQQLYGTLAHELFHLMVRRDFGDVPPWLDEGISALYEVSRADEDGTIRGVPNWRGPVLRQLWSYRPSVADLVRADWPAFEATYANDATRQAANHATARYLALYLQDQGLLPAVFNAFHKLNPVAAGPPGDPVETLESAVGVTAQELDDRFAEWFRGLPN